MGLSDLNGCFTNGFPIQGVLHLRFHLLMIPLPGYLPSVAVLARSRQAFVLWQVAELHFPQAALRWAIKVNKKVSKVLGKKRVRLRKAGGGRQQESNGIKECGLGERAERPRHSSDVAAFRCPCFLFARYYGLTMCNS